MLTDQIHFKFGTFYNSNCRTIIDYEKENVQICDPTDVVHWPILYFPENIFYMNLGSFWQNCSFIIFHSRIIIKKKIKTALLWYLKLRSPSFKPVNISFC